MSLVVVGGTKVMEKISILLPIPRTESSRRIASANVDYRHPIHTGDILPRVNRGTWNSPLEGRIPRTSFLSCWAQNSGCLRKYSQLTDIFYLYLMRLSLSFHLLIYPIRSGGCPAGRDRVSPDDFLPKADRVSIASTIGAALPFFIAMV